MTAAAGEAMAAKHGPASVRAYVANAVHYVAALRSPPWTKGGGGGGGGGGGLVAVLEDDVVAGMCPAAAGRRVAEAIRQLPPTADMLYLEVRGWWSGGGSGRRGRGGLLADAAAAACWLTRPRRLVG